jgi:BASS family bile acid:Na+ symporter
MWPTIQGLLGNGVGLMLAVFALIGLLVGHLLGGPVPGDRTTLAISTAARHPAVAMTIVSATQADKKSALAVILLYLIISFIVTIPYQRWRKGAAQAG